MCFVLFHIFYKNVFFSESYYKNYSYTWKLNTNLFWGKKDYLLYLDILRVKFLLFIFLVTSYIIFTCCYLHILNSTNFLGLTNCDSAIQYNKYFSVLHIGFEKFLFFHHPHFFQNCCYTVSYLMKFGNGHFKCFLLAITQGHIKQYAGFQYSW